MKSIEAMKVAAQWMGRTCMACVNAGRRMAKGAAAILQITSGERGPPLSQPSYYHDWSANPHLAKKKTMAKRGSMKSFSRGTLRACTDLAVWSKGLLRHIQSEDML